MCCRRTKVLAKVPWVSPMQEFIHRKNIENYRKQLECKLEASERKLIASLLAEEEAKESPARSGDETTFRFLIVCLGSVHFSASVAWRSPPGSRDLSQ